MLRNALVLIRDRSATAEAVPAIELDRRRERARRVVRAIRSSTVACTIGLVALSQAAGAVCLTAQAPDHRLWARVRPPGPASEARECANWTGWNVGVAADDAGRLITAIETVGQSARLGAQGPPPFPLVSDIRGPGRTLWRRAADGYVVAFNHGEFGGSLWWYSLSGSSRTRIGDAAVIGFADIQLPSRDVVIATIEGLAHLTAESGELRVVERRSPGAFTLSSVARIGGAPQAVGHGKGGSLVVTNSGILQVGSDGGLDTIAAVDFSDLYPDSIVETAEGLIYVGARRYLVQIDPHARTTRWYTRADCPRFRVDSANVTCRCR
jgi:hypothetical protein